VTFLPAVIKMQGLQEVITDLGYSIGVTLAPQFFSVEGIHVVSYFDTAASLITLILLGRWLEAKARGRMSGAIKRLLGLQPTTACVRRGGAEAVE
jgi:cation transport ATPase